MMELLDHYNSHLRSLKTLGRNVDHWDDLVVYLMSSKLDTESKSRWIDAIPANRMPSFEDLSEFLRSRSHKLENHLKAVTMNSTSTKFQQSKSSVRPTRFSTTLNVTNSHANSPLQCIYCKKLKHTIVRCHKFLSLPLENRLTFVETAKLCQNCLRVDHNVTACSITSRCRHCQQNHHSLIHPSQSTKSSPTQVQDCLSSTSIFAHASSVPTKLAEPRSISSSFVYLATALVKVLDVHGRPIIARALLDSGSQMNFLTESFATKLMVPRSRTKTKVQGIGSNLISSYSFSTITISSTTSNYFTDLNIHIIPKITGYQPSCYITDVSNWKIPTNIQLADPSFYKPHAIDLLIGAEIYADLLCVGQIKSMENLPTLQNTLLGWVVSGKFMPQVESTSTSNSCHFISNIIDNHSLDNQIEQFWTIENLPHSEKPLSDLEEACETHFSKHTTRNDEGRFVVRLPFCTTPSSLGNSRSLAERRFLNLESRLHRNPDLLSAYSEFMNEYESLHHMSLIENSSIKSPNYFFPHHCVIKPESSTTKLRVVFDGSAKTSTGSSLNSLLMVGRVDTDLFSNLVRFRAPKYAFSADISKMYRQIMIHKEDQQFQYILWRENICDDIKTFKLNTVTYGTASAPFLSIRCLKQLAIENRSTYPNAADAIENNIYVDDLLTGANSIDDARKLKAEIEIVLKSAKMELRKWCSNESAVIQDVPVEFTEQLLTIEGNELVKTLGIYWQPTADKFMFHVNFNNSSVVSKRSIFSQVARIFDPLGLLSPVVVMGKLLIQKLWQLKLDWDQSIPQHLYTEWLHFRQGIAHLGQFSIERHLFGTINPESIQLHGFADASERAYGAVIYIRSTTSENSVDIRLLCSKSRIAPLKTTSLPRLELCASVLLAELVDKVRPHLTFQVDEYYNWSDSMIVLCWINSCPSKLKTFVANRVASIQKITDISSWRHVPSEKNPADLISRGLSPEKLYQTKLWTDGPSFLNSPKNMWPSPINGTPLAELPEMKHTPFTVATCIQNSSEVTNCVVLNTIKNDNFLSSQKVIAYVLRFIDIKLKRDLSQFGHTLQPIELDRALHTIIRVVQRTCFPIEYVGLKKPKFVVRNSKLKSLSLFLDNDDIIRVGGRLQRSTLPFYSKHPILLPNNHNFTLNLLLFYHRKLLHPGPQALLASVREYYWPIKGRSLCNKIYRECMLCFRIRPNIFRQQLGQLPPDRITPAPPFHKVGVDFCGPFYTHYRIRGKPPTKTYLCVFICFVTKSVHLELASDLTTQSFLGAFKRFISSRGLCKYVFSDNATNFSGANNELHELYELISSPRLRSELQSYCEEDRIIWKFTPPASPNFGGLHESGVKLAKYHIRRCIGNAKFTYEQLLTLIKMVEAVLNSRPLTPISSNPDDFSCLTPGHFLIGRPLTAPPIPNITDRPLIDTWHHINQCFTHFWNRWSVEYLRSQQQRHKWTSTNANLNIDDLVVIVDDNLPPLKWKLGRVIATYPGEDNLVRVVKLKTAQGELKRGISKICKLPSSVETAMSFQGGENVNASN